MAAEHIAWSSDGYYDVHTEDPYLVQLFDINWFIDIYCYATGADPRNTTAENFTRAGGVVYTVAIYRGNLQRSPKSPQRYLGPTSGYCHYWFCDYHSLRSYSKDMVTLEYEPMGVDSIYDSVYNCKHFSCLRTSSFHD